MKVVILPVVMMRLSGMLDIAIHMPLHLDTKKLTSAVVDITTTDLVLLQ